MKTTDANFTSTLTVGTQFRDLAIGLVHNPGRSVRHADLAALVLFGKDHQADHDGILVARLRLTEAASRGNPVAVELLATISKTA